MTIFRQIYIGVDPAVGEEQRNDCTAIIAGMTFSEKIAGRYTNKVYILPEFINKRMNFRDAIEAILEEHALIKRTYNIPEYQITILIENGGQQKSFYDQLCGECSFSPKYIKLVPTQGIDKRSRIAAACSYMQSKRVFLPKDRMDNLESQLLYFGAEKHDDLADAFAMVVNEAMRDIPLTMGVATADFFGENRKQKRFFAHGQWHDGDPNEYYRRMKEIQDAKDKFYNDRIIAGLHINSASSIWLD